MNNQEYILCFVLHEREHWMKLLLLLLHFNDECELSSYNWPWTSYGSYNLCAPVAGEKLLRALALLYHTLYSNILWPCTTWKSVHRDSSWLPKTNQLICIGLYLASWCCWLRGVGFAKPRKILWATDNLFFCGKQKIQYPI